MRQEIEGVMGRHYRVEPLYKKEKRNDEVAVAIAQLEKAVAILKKVLSENTQGNNDRKEEVHGAERGGS